MNEFKAAVYAALAGLAAIGLAFITAGVLAPKVSTTVAEVRSSAAASTVITSADVVSGGKYFATSCSGCHGQTGAGGTAPNLHDEDMTPSQMSQTIRNGNGPMPPFAGTYTSTQINQIVGYIQTLK